MVKQRENSLFFRTGVCFRFAGLRNELCVGIISQLSTNRELSGRRSRRNSESRRDVRAEAGVESRSDGTPANHKKQSEPRAEREGASGGCYALNPNPLPPTRFARGSVSFCLLAGAAPAARAYPCLPSYVPSGLKFRSADASQPARQSRGCCYCLMMPIRNLCPLIMLAGSGACVYQQI